MSDALHGWRLRAPALLGALALCLGVAQAAGAADEGQGGPGRWIFKYDRSQREPPPELQAPPRYLGTLTSVEKRGGSEQPWRLKLDDLRQGKQTIYVTEETKVEGAPIKDKAKALQAKAHVAVYGEDKEGRFYASSIFLVPAEEWQAILEARRAEEERAKQVEAPPGQTPAGTAEPPPPEAPPTEGKPTVGEAPGREVGLPEEELGVPKEGPQPEAAPPDEEKPADQEHRGDFRATVKAVRARGTEMSVVREGKVILVTTGAQTTILDGEEKLRPSDVKEGWTIDVEVARWRGKSNCVAKRVWVVKR